MKGYRGKILRVNVKTRESRVVPLSDEVARDFVGGRGFCAKILYDELSSSVAPLSPDNLVVVAPGPFSGLPIPCSGKTTFASKSPLTGGYGDSNVGGHLAAEIRLSGYDALVIEGASDAPVCVVVDDDKVEVRDASPYWGKGCFDAEAMLKRDLGEDFAIAMIGPAGENLVKMASIGHDWGRQAGRTGIAAVLGSKKVKAIAVRGSKSIPVADPKGLYEKGKEMFRKVFSMPGFREWTPYGTAGVTDWVNEVGAFPTKNFYTGHFEGYQKINGKALREKIMVMEKGCFSCPIPCGKYSRIIRDGKEYYVEGPEYETIAMMGGNLLIDDISAIAYLNWIADDLGIDTISGGNAIAFLLECMERGVVSPSEAGRDASFGDVEAAAYFLRCIAYRQGIGDILAEGVRYAATRFGKGSEKFAMQVKGMEISGYESRYAPGMMLAYMTCDIGAHHNRAWAITYDVATGRDVLEGKAERVIYLQHLRPLFDSLGVCRFPWVELGFEPEEYAKVYGLVAGEPRTLDELLLCSERTWNLARCFNVKHVPGFGRAYDYPPERWLSEPAPSGPAAGKGSSREQAEKLLDDYYSLRGWTKEGIPTKEKLQFLGLEYVAEELNL